MSPIPASPAVPFPASLSLLGILKIIDGGTVMIVLKLLPSEYNWNCFVSHLPCAIGPYISICSVINVSHTD